MSIIKARGEQAAANAAGGGSAKLKDTLIKVGKGDAVRVRILGQYDYAEWDAHGLFSPRIITRPCIAALGQDCPDCAVFEHLKANFERDSDEREQFGGIRKQQRYLMAFGVLATGELGVFDASKSQFNALRTTIDKNAKPDDDGEIAIKQYAFDLSRTNGDKTTYSLDLVPKLSKKEQEQFAKFDGVEVPDAFFEALLAARSRQDMIKDLQAAGVDFGLFGEGDGGEKPMSDDPTDQF